MIFYSRENARTVVRQAMLKWSHFFTLFHTLSHFVTLISHMISHFCSGACVICAVTDPVITLSYHSITVAQLMPRLNTHTGPPHLKLCRLFDQYLQGRELHRSPSRNCDITIHTHTAVITAVLATPTISTQSFSVKRVSPRGRSSFTILRSHTFTTFRT